MKPSIIAEKSFAFAEVVVETYKKLIYERKEYVLSKQFLRSGTSIGANVSEAMFGQSKKDFASKLSIARKEANETIYWIRLMQRTGFLENDVTTTLKELCEEILRLLTAIIKTVEINSRNS
jgi:four helix bundle protein